VLTGRGPRRPQRRAARQGLGPRRLRGLRLTLEERHLQKRLQRSLLESCACLCYRPASPTDLFPLQTCCRYRRPAPATDLRQLQTCLRQVSRDCLRAGGMKPGREGRDTSLGACLPARRLMGRFLGPAKGRNKFTLIHEEVTSQGSPCSKDRGGALVKGVKSWPRGIRSVQLNSPPLERVANLRVPSGGMTLEAHTSKHLQKR